MKIYSKSLFFFALCSLSALLLLFTDYFKACFDSLRLSNGISADAISFVIPADQDYACELSDIIHTIEESCDSFSVIKKSSKNYVYCYSKNNHLDILLTEGTYFSDDDFLLHRNVALVCEALKPRLSRSGVDYILELDGCSFDVIGFYKTSTNSVHLQPDAIINMSADMISAADKIIHGMYYLQTSNSGDKSSVMHILQSDFNAIEGEMPVARSLSEMLKNADGASFFSKTMRRFGALICFAFMLIVFVSERYKLRGELMQRWICGATLSTLRRELYLRNTVSLSLPAVFALCVCFLLPQYSAGIIFICLLWVFFANMLVIGFNLKILRGKIND